MAQLTKADLRGFLVPYRLTKENIWTAESTYTEDDYFASTPTAATPSKMTIKATGNPISTADFQVLTRRAGINRSAGFSIRNNADSNTIEYGNDSPSSISYLETLTYKTGGAAGDIGLYPSTLSFDDGTLLTACQYTNLAAGINRSVYVFRRDKDGNVSSTSIFAYSTAELSLVSQSTNPALCKLDDGSVLLAFPYEDGTQITFRIYRSTDRGATFELASKNAVDYYIPVGSGGSDYLLKGVKMASCNGQVMLLVETYFNTATNAQNRLFQFTSVDGGGNFKLVTESDKLDDYAFAGVNLMVRNNQFIVSYVGSLTEIHYMILPHAFYQIQDMRGSAKYITAVTAAALGTGTDLAIENADLCTWIDDSNDIWLAFHDLNTDSIRFAFSEDENTFYSSTLLSTLFFMETRAGTAHTYIKNIDAVSYLGGSILAFNWSTNTAITGDSLGVLFLGGYSNNPSLDTKNDFLKQNAYNRKTYTFTYLPLETPPNLNSLTTTGTGTEDLLTAGFLNVNVAFPQSDRKYLWTGSNAQNGGYVKAIFYDVAIGSGADVGQTYIEVTHTGVTKLKSGIKILARASQFTIIDSISGASLATITQNSFTGTEIFIAINTNTATVWYKSMSNDNLRKYTVALDTTTLSTVAAASSFILTAEFGIDNFPTVGTAKVKFKAFLVGSDNAVGKNLISQNSDELSFRAYPDTGNFLYLDDKINIAVQNGVTYHGENWQILPESTYPIDNIFHLVSPTPRNYWISDSVGSGAKSAERIAFNLDKSGSSNVTELGNDIIGVHLGNINFRTFSLQYHNGVSWVTKSAIDTSENMHHGYVLRGLTLIQDKTNVVDQNYYFYNELKGYVAECTVGATVTYHKIVSNTEGVFGNSNAKICTILLETAPTGNGTVKIIPSDVTIAISLNGIQAAAWAILIDAQETIDLNFRIGHLSMGPIAITGTQYSRGRQILIESGSITTEQPDRTAYTRTVAPIRRKVDISWSDGVDISGFYDNNPDPDYYKSSSSGGALAVSNYQDAPYMMEGLLTYLQGNQLPLVYLPALSTSDDTRVFNRRAEHMLATIEGDISIESVTGDELRGNGDGGEVMRIGTITVQEVV